jgi:hypothetical protein
MKPISCEGALYENITTRQGDRITECKDLVLFQAMVNSAASAFQLAIDIYKDQRSYAEMIYHGWTILEKFHWEKTIRITDEITS